MYAPIFRRDVLGWDGTDKRANFIVEAYLMVFNLLTIFSFIIPVFMGLYHMKNIFL